MSDEDKSGGGSVTIWIGDLKNGGDAAAQHLWERYNDQLVRLARARLMQLNAGRAVSDEDDVVNHAFNSFITRARLGKFSKLADRNDLWLILVKMTKNKASNQNRDEMRAKRGGGRVIGEAALAGGKPCEEGHALENVQGARLVRFRDGNLEVELEPTPEFAVLVAEEFRLGMGALDALGDPLLQPIALRKMEGYAAEEIAQEMGVTKRTVNRKLEVIRGILTGELS